MEYLTDIKISKKETDRLKKLAGKTIKFSPGINFLVGDNGIGKSGILYDLSDKLRKNQLVKAHVTAPLFIHHFDTEKMNPRVRTEVSIFGMHSRFISHGECIDQVLKEFKMLIKPKGINHLLLIDEPEGGMSPWKQQELLELYIKYSKKVQIIVATHSLVFTNSKVGRLIELTEEKINYFDPPSSYNWRGLKWNN